MKLTAPLDANLHELRRVVTERLPAPPAAPVEGQRYYDDTLNQERYWDGTTWISGGQGPAGPPGPAGASANLFRYNYSSNTVPPPNSGQVRSDGASAATATTIWVHRLDVDNLDERIQLMLGKAGDRLFIQDAQDATSYAVYQLGADPVDNTSYVTFAVTLLDSGPTPLLGSGVLLGVLREGPQGPPGPAGPAGPGVAAGGTTGQVLSKKTTTDYDTQWIDPPAAGVSSVDGRTGAVVLSDIYVNVTGDTMTGALDLNKNELKQVVTHKLATPPSSPAEGQRYYDTALKVERYWDGTKWSDQTDVWVGASAPTGTPSIGDQWVDTDEDPVVGTTLPLSVTYGGTGATSAATARTNLGINLPLAVADGGTGGTTAAAARTSLATPQVGQSGSATGPPTTGTWARGDTWIDSLDVLWVCRIAGTQGTWVSVPMSRTVSLRVYGPFSVTTSAIAPNTELASPSYAHGLGTTPTLVLAEIEDGFYASFCSFRVIRDATNVAFNVANKHASQNATAVVRFLIFV